ncbi:MAG: hypothetical protein ACREJ9_15965, partial [Candidatus Rokuibacteriota bacterium]
MAHVETVRPSRAWALRAGAGFAALVIWSWQGARVDLQSLLGGEGLRQIALYVGKLFPPDLSTSMLREAGTGAVET